MKHGWLERMLEAVADRGRDLLKLEPGSRGTGDPASLCRQLLSGRGEASNIALARAVLQLYAGYDTEQRLGFFRMLLDDFGPDLARMQAAMERYAASRAPEDLVRLNQAVEPPRQELFRRLNTAPNGTASLVALRADLLGFQREHPELAAVDADLKHLLSSWFNRGFLQMRAIDWRSPAHILEKLINYEAVHEIQGWEDLHRRLMADRRCFAFFHPAMPDEPLIFVEVALVRGIADRVQPLIDPGAPTLAPEDADTAVFYSINNTQVGLRGISFGNFLIKQVVTELRSELPALRHFATLSPLPRFAATVRGAWSGEQQGFSRERLSALVGRHREALCSAAGMDDPVRALERLLEGDPRQDEELLAEPLTELALAYLTTPRPGSGLLDPVATFHLANGARLERINPFADGSRRGLRNGFGVMVNYLYVPEEVEANHERFVGAGEVVLSKSLQRLRRRLEEPQSQAAE